MDKDEGEVKIFRRDLVDIKPGEAFFRILLKEKGVPMKGTFFPEFMLDEYTYTRFEDQCTDSIVYQFKRVQK